MTLLDLIKPAGEIDAEVIQFQGRKKRTAKWCKVCGRKHSKDVPCDLVEYQQGGEYEKMAFDEEAGAERLKTFRHPGRFRPKPRKADDE